MQAHESWKSFIRRDADLKNEKTRFVRRLYFQVKLKIVLWLENGKDFHKQHVTKKQKSWNSNGFKGMNDKRDNKIMPIDKKGRPMEIHEILPPPKFKKSSDTACAKPL